MPQRYAKDPYFITVRRPATCSCGAPINVGDRCFYYPNGKTVLCQDKCSEPAARDFQAAAEDEAFMSGGREEHEGVNFSFRETF